MDCLPNDETEARSPILFTLVSAPHSFQTMMKCLVPAHRLAIDMEADSLYHYFEKVCLIQISTDTDTFILDPLAVSDIEELGALMSDPSLEKVFHAAGYDVFCLRRDFGFDFANIFDTHIAAQLLGYEFLGLGALMEELLGIHHSKRRQRDDWSHRPLDPEQLEYAAMDTHHLLQLRDVLEAELRQKGRLAWAGEEFDAAAAAERPTKEFDPEGFRRIKGNRELPQQDQAVLRALYIFRDKAARKLDVPPFKVMNNSVLLDLARKSPMSRQELSNRPGVSYRISRRFADDLLDTIRQARRQSPSVLESTARVSWKLPSRAAKMRLEALKAWRKEKAGELGLHVGVVFPANLLENLAAAPPADPEELENLPGMRRWRVQEFGEEILALLRSQAAQFDFLNA